MRENYNNLTKDAFKTTVVVHTSQGPSTPAAKQAKRAPPPDADSSMEEDEWETPTSIDATSHASRSKPCLTTRASCPTRRRQAWAGP